MDIAVPANLRCGQPDGVTALPREPGWAPLTCTFGGVWEIQPATLSESLAATGAPAIQVLDVREPVEFSDALGHIRGARLLPLSQLAARVGELDRQRPVVAVCRSGARSAQATVLLQKSGFEDVANLAGGMLRWRAEALPTEGGADWA
jgi:rhodanese-related sulfurtransferase